MLSLNHRSSGLLAAKFKQLSVDERTKDVVASYVSGINDSLVERISSDKTFIESPGKKKWPPEVRDPPTLKLRETDVETNARLKKLAEARRLKTQLEERMSYINNSIELFSSDQSSKGRNLHAPTLRLSYRSREFSVGELGSLADSHQLPQSSKGDLMDTKRFLDKLRHDKEVRHSRIEKIEEFKRAEREKAAEELRRREEEEREREVERKRSEIQDKLRKKQQDRLKEV